MTVAFAWVDGYESSLVPAPLQNCRSVNHGGPETKATPTIVPENAWYIGIIFKLGAFMPQLPGSHLVNGALNLPDATSPSFWLDSSAWQFPDYENADTFVDRLVRDGLLVREPVVAAALQGQLNEPSLRSVQRRFLRATGVTHRAVYQIERARYATILLKRGVSISTRADPSSFHTCSKGTHWR